jgi:hypothetical protein
MSSINVGSLVVLICRLRSPVICSLSHDENIVNDIYGYIGGEVQVMRITYFVQEPGILNSLCFLLGRCRIYLSILMYVRVSYLREARV